MKTRRKTWISISMVAVLLVGGATVRLRPHWATASRAEVDKVLDARLLAKDPPDPAAANRYIRFSELLKDFKLTGLRTAMPTAAEISAEAAAFRKANGKLLPRLRKLLSEGPYRGPERKILDFDESARTKAIAKELGSLIEDSATPPADRLASLELGELFVLRCYEDSHNYIEFLVSLAIEAIIDSAARNLISAVDLPAVKLKLLFGRLPNLERETALQNTVVGEFQSRDYKLLPDPMAYVRQMVDENSAISEASKALNPNANVEIGDPPGNYDAIEAAKEFNDLTVEDLKNAGLRPAEMKFPVADRVAKIVSALPSDNFGTKEGLALWWAQELYRVRMNATPNSYAYYVAPGHLLPEVARARDRARAWHRLLLLQIACELHAGQQGHLPASLDELVRTKAIQEIPQDPLGNGLMHYDLSKKILWSVGIDGVDDHGSELKTGIRTADLVVHLR